MEILERLKSLIGVGLPTITVTGFERTARSGDVLRGTVVLTGGDHDVPLSQISLRLEQQMLVYTVTGGVDEPERHLQQHVVEAQQSFEARVLAAGEQLAQDFEITVPPGLEPSAGLNVYALVAECEVPGPNPRADLPIVIVG